MDSLTQAVLGAAVGEAVLGRKLGNKAMLWGALIGSVPDLDILAYPWMDAVGQLRWHRSASHSVLFCILATPVIGMLLRGIHRGAVGFRRATAFAFLALATHIGIDLFTVYGTQIGWPFTDRAVSFSSVFIVDPLYTLPLLIPLLVLWVFRSDRPVRRRLNAVGLVASTLYLGWSLGAKAVVSRGFGRELAGQGIAVERMTTAPTAFNTVVWRCLAETRDGYWVGFRSVFGRGTTRFEFVARESENLAPVADTSPARALLWFSQGWYTVRASQEGPVFSDLRFGEVNRPMEGETGPPQSVFRWLLATVPERGGSADSPALVPMLPRFAERKAVVGSLVRKAWGE